MGWMEGKFFFCGDCILWKEILFSFGTGEGWLYGRECFYSHSVGMRSALGSLVCVFKESSPRSLSSSFRLDCPFRITLWVCRQVLGGHLQRTTIAFVFSGEMHVPTTPDCQFASQSKPSSTLRSIARNVQTTLCPAQSTSPCCSKFGNYFILQIWTRIAFPTIKFISADLPPTSSDLSLGYACCLERAVLHFWLDCCKLGF